MGVARLQLRSATRYSQRVHSQAAFISPEVFDQVPVLPLPNVVLFPHVMLPMQLNDVGAWQMMHDVHTGSRHLVVVGPDDNAPGGLQPVGCLAQLVQLQPANPPHPAQALLQGVRRVQLLQEHTRIKPYRQFHVQPLAAPCASTSARSRSAATLHHFIRLLAEAAVPRDPPLTQLLHASHHPDHLADILAASLCQGVPRQQAILASPTHESQIERMTEGLAEALLKLVAAPLAATARD